MTLAPDFQSSAAPSPDCPFITMTPCGWSIQYLSFKIHWPLPLCFSSSFQTFFLKYDHCLDLTPLWNLKLYYISLQVKPSMPLPLSLPSSHYIFMTALTLAATFLTVYAHSDFACSSTKEYFTLIQSTPTQHKFISLQLRLGPPSLLMKTRFH